MYEVVLSRSAQKDLLRLPADQQDRIIGVLERASVSPLQHVKRLSGSDAYRLRAGKLRIILDINEKAKRIEVLRIGNRETVYS